MRKTDKNNGFKTPENYFESFTDNLFAKLAKEQSVLPKKEGFQVPEGYLERFGVEKLSKINAPEPKVISLRSYKKYYYVAASIAAIFLVVFGLQWEKGVSIGFEDLAASDIEQYFESNDADFSTYEIAEMIPVSQLELNDMFEPKITDETMIDYLDDNIDDIEELNLQKNE